MALYSEKVMDHFRHPRNVGSIENADGVGEVGNAVCGDIMKIYLKIDDDIVTDVKFETFGCGSAIASSSMATELIKGKSLAEVMTLTNKAVAEALGTGCPFTSCIARFWRKRRLKPPSTITVKKIRPPTFGRQIKIFKGRSAQLACSISFLVTLPSLMSSSTHAP